MGSDSRDPTCRSKTCGAPIMWCKTSAGNTIPIDPKPAPDGNLVIVDGLVRARREVDIQLGRPAYKAHFATCTDPLAWRKTGHER